MGEGERSLCDTTLFCKFASGIVNCLGMQVVRHSINSPKSQHVLIGLVHVCKELYQGENGAGGNICWVSSTRG